jgi:hypothetical protein
MNKVNKILLGGLGFSILFLILGAWLKLNGNYSFQWMIPLALVCKPIIIITLIIYNYKNVKVLLK